MTIICHCNQFCVNISGNWCEDSVFEQYFCVPLKSAFKNSLIRSNSRFPPNLPEMLAVLFHFTSAAIRGDHQPAIPEE